MVINAIDRGYIMQKVYDPVLHENYKYNEVASSQALLQKIAIS